MRGKSWPTFVQFNDSFYTIFYLYTARWTLAFSLSSLLWRSWTAFFETWKHKLVAASLAHDMTTPSQSYDLLMAKFLAAHLTNILSRLFILSQLQCDKVFVSKLVALIDLFLRLAICILSDSCIRADQSWLFSFVLFLVSLQLFNIGVLRHPKTRFDPLFFGHLA